MYKTFLAILFLAVAGLSASDIPEGVPKGATQSAPGVYRHVDKDGKTWVYRTTPFGIVKRAAEDAADQSGSKSAPAAGERSRHTPFGKQNDFTEPDSAPKAPAKTARPDVKVIEEGDSVRFERPGPFGIQRWTRKKSELTAEDRDLWESSRPAASEKGGK